ncbi:hypothetical protein M422DRAFT_257734 [Sphaerobolus stellatus SS14]|uniref:Uncharacterized protein n=1 Tax=Sphaerobolus stellatus (strain SS14) TaxID=990650 RepID=A0A0C9VN66_SPHS4|nr:hypothetical protein M422DRAFT_257734 [Sphaerobolus stellatus SS14]
MLLAWLNVWMARPSFNIGVYLPSLYAPRLTSLSARIIKEGPSPHSPKPYFPSSSAPYNLLRPLLLRAIAPPILHNDLLIVILHPHNLTHRFLLDPNSFTLAKQTAQSGGEPSRNLHEPQTRFRGGAFGAVRTRYYVGSAEDETGGRRGAELTKKVRGQGCYSEELWDEPGGEEGVEGRREERGVATGVPRRGRGKANRRKKTRR